MRGDGIKGLKFEYLLGVRENFSVYVLLGKYGLVNKIIFR